MKSYRLQIAATDLAAVAIAIGARNEAGFYAGLATYAVGGPIVHAVHQRKGRMLASLAVRLALPTTLVVVAELGDNCSKDNWDCDEDIPVAVFLGAIGMVVASTLDIGVIAAPPSVRKPAAAWAPQVYATGDRVQVGLVGQF